MSPFVLGGICGAFVGVVVGVVVTSLSATSKISDMKAIMDRLMEEKTNLQKEVHRLHIKLRRAESETERRK